MGRESLPIQINLFQALAFVVFFKLMDWSADWFCLKTLLIAFEIPEKAIESICNNRPTTFILYTSKDNNTYIRKHIKNDIIKKWLL